MMDTLPETQIARTSKYQGVVVKVFQDTVTLPQGQERLRDVVIHPGGVCILAELENGDLLLIRQFRYILGKYIYEFPAGKLDGAEDHLLAAQRELLEETGYRAQTWQKLTRIVMTPGFCNEEITLFYATNLTYEKPQQEEDEYIEVLTRTPQEIATMIHEGTITDAKTLCAFSLVYPKELCSI